MLMPKDMNQSGASHAKCNALKIKAISKNTSIFNIFFILGMLMYVSMNKKFDKGFLTYFGVNMFLFGINCIVFSVIDYVRFGSRRKLAAKGFHSKMDYFSKKVFGDDGTGSTTVGSTTNSVSSSSVEGSSVEGSSMEEKA